MEITIEQLLTQIVMSCKWFMSLALHIMLK